jgi:hypothetical protein
VLRPETSRGGLVAGRRQGFTRHVEHTRDSDGERGQALPGRGERSGGGDWSGQQAHHVVSGGGIHGALSRAAEEARMRQAQR